MMTGEGEQGLAEHSPAIRMRAAGEHGLVVEMGKVISPRINAGIQRLAKRLCRQRPEGVIEVVPAYCSLLVDFDPLVLSRAELIAAITRMLAVEPGAETAEEELVRVVKVPVCYGGEHGPDLEDLADWHGLSPEEVISIHCSRPYLVYMLGFTPGFPYLGGMSDRIATPRLEKPRTKVAQGSVGIAGTQTGLYPIESPGGWRIIGRTPLKPFQPGTAHPFLFSAGDFVQFYAISSALFEAIRREVEGGLYAPEVLTIPRERLGYDQGN